MKLPEHKHFFAVNGKKAENLLDLRALIAEMSEKDFKHHTTQARNDFANWLRDIMHKDYLADRIGEVHSREDVLELINDEIMKDREIEAQDSDEFKRFIVREFIYGLIFGIIIGIILSKLI